MAIELRLNGLRALVTGGNSGIGEAVAMALAQAGADVCINYIAHREAAADVVERLERHGGNALALRADVAKLEAVQAMFQELDRQWGGIDILINNAGIDGPRALSWESETRQWERVININLLGSYYCAREALRRMVPQGKGVILALSSVHEVIPWSGYSAYTASKAGLGMMMKTMAQEAAEHGVRVLSVAPGAIRTSINASVWENTASRADLASKIPMGRMGNAAEIGRLVAVLCSDAASYVTGTTVFADGGMTLYPAFEHGG